VVLDGLPRVGGRGHLRYDAVDPSVRRTRSPERKVLYFLFSGEHEYHFQQKGVRPAR